MLAWRLLPLTRFSMRGRFRRPIIFDNSWSILGHPFQESGQVVGDMIDMGRVAAFELPVLAKHFAGLFRHDQNGGHAERMWHFEVAREVLEHGRLAGIDAMGPEEAVVGLRRWFRLELGGDDVEHRSEEHTSELQSLRQLV